MTPNDYEFNTGAKEIMTVIEGKLTIQLKGRNQMEGLYKWGVF